MIVKKLSQTNARLHISINKGRKSGTVKPSIGLQSFFHNHLSLLAKNFASQMSCMAGGHMLLLSDM